MNQPIKITLDHHSLILNHRHPVIKELKNLEKQGYVRLYHSDNLRRHLEKLTPTEEKLYHKIREVIFGKQQQDLTLIEHGDICLLINHLKNKRDYFLTLDGEKYRKLKGHRSLEIRMPDEKFLKEIKKHIKTLEKCKKKKGVI